MKAAIAYLALFSLAATALIWITTATFAYHPQDHVVHSFKPSRPGIPSTNYVIEHVSEQETTTWLWDRKRDGRNYGLDEEQCHIAFPLLYKEIDRAVAYRRRNKIRVEELDTAWRGDGIVRAMIWNNQLYIIEGRGVWDKNHRPRSIATLHAIHRAVIAYPDVLPNIEFTVTHHDFAETGGPHVHHTTWAYSRLPEHESLWLMPDFGLWGWPDVGLRSYGELHAMITETEEEFVDKKPQLVWRGSVAVGSHDIRNSLVAVSAHKSWSDVQILDWSNKTNIEERLLTMEDHCMYMFVAQTEGNTYSGRLKYLLNCQSVLVSHKLRFIEHYHHLMIPHGPEQNFIQVERDFSDLEKTITEYLKPENIFDTERISQNAKSTFADRYLTPAAEACYWRQLFRGWSEVQGFKPEFWKDVTVEKGGKNFTTRKPRGVPFEAYAILEATEWTLPTKPRKICEYGSP